MLFILLSFNFGDLSTVVNFTKEKAHMKINGFTVLVVPKFVIAKHYQLNSADKFLVIAMYFHIRVCCCKDRYTINFIKVIMALL